MSSLAHYNCCFVELTSSITLCVMLLLTHTALYTIEHTVYSKYCFVNVCFSGLVDRGFLNGVIILDMLLDMTLKCV